MENVYSHDGDLIGWVYETAGGVWGMCDERD